MTMDYFERVDTIQSALCELTGEQVYGLFTGWHGLQLLDERFYEHLVREGVLEDEDEDEDEDEGEEMYLTKNQLWALRQEIVLNSLYVADYQNSFGYTAKSVCDFFDGYMDYLDELATEEHGRDCSLEEIFSFDNAENLSAWYGCFESCPFQREA